MLKLVLRKLMVNENTIIEDNVVHIRSFSDLKEFLAADKWALGIKGNKPHFIGDYIWKYQIALRKHEYYLNCHPHSFMKLYWAFKHQKLGLKLGFDIPCNTFGKGLRINHYGLIIVNPKARIGDFCDIHQGVNIGTNTDRKVPIIGNNVYIAPGVKIFGGITIGHNVMIGANAVVTKDFPDKVVIMGIPAEIKKKTGNIYNRETEWQQKSIKKSE